MKVWMERDSERLTFSIDFERSANGDVPTSRYPSFTVLALAHYQRIPMSDSRNPLNYYLKYLQLEKPDWIAMVDQAIAPPPPADLTPLGT